MDRIKNILRWIVMIPAAAVGCRIVVMLTMILLKTGNLFNLPTFAEFGSNIFNFIGEYILSAYVFIYIINYIAPSHKKAACYISSSVITLIIFVATAVISLAYNTYPFDFTGTIGLILTIITMFISSHSMNNE